MNDASHVRCSVCGVELERVSSSDAALIHACESCGQNLRDISHHGRALVVSAVRKRMEREAPRLYGVMQALWKLTTEGPAHE